MGQRGKLSTATVMQRNRSAARDVTTEPTAPKGLPAAARREWERITALLRQRNCLDALDQAALRDYLVCWQRLNECEADIAARGILVKGYRSALTKNPSVALARQYREHLLAWSKELGFTIGSRARLAVPQQEKPRVNPFSLLERESDPEADEEFQELVRDTFAE